jgi:hypothetical protein
MSKAIDKAIGKRRCDWICQDHKIYKRSYRAIVCGYYYDGPPSGYYIGTFKAPLFRKWEAGVLPHAQTLPRPNDFVEKPMKPRDLAIIVEQRILGDAETGFREPSLQEYVDLLDAVFSSGRRGWPSYHYLQERAYALILLDRTEPAGLSLHELVERWWSKISADDQDEIRKVLSTLAEDSFKAKAFIQSKIAANKKMLGLA